MATTFKQLMEVLEGHRDTIKSKFADMGLNTGAGKLADVATAAESIAIHSDTGVELSSGESQTLPAGYYPNDVLVEADAAKLNNIYYADAEGYTENKSLSIPFVTETTQTGSGYSIASQSAVTITAPYGYIISSATPTLGTVTSSAFSKGSLAATATMSDNSKTCTVELTGQVQGGYGSATAIVSCVIVYATTTEYTGGTAVTPTTKEKTYYAEDDTFMTAFTVAAIPIENGSVSEVSNIIATKSEAEADSTYELNAAADKYMQSVSVKKVVIDSTTVDSATLYNNTEGSLVIKASELGCDGISEISIPRPSISEATEGDTDVDLLNIELSDGGSDHIVSIPAGYYASSTEVTIRTDELYDALAAI